ncbi:MAG TPA: cytochrome P450 [Acidimicrobiia bacterium]|jgi:cytochrome P450
MTARETGSTDATRTLFSPHTADDPHPAYERVRRECPVARIGPDDEEGRTRGQVFLSRYDDIFWAMRNPEYFTSEDLDLYLGEQPQIPLEVDPPAHTKYRRLLNPQFVPREIERHEPEVRSIVRELIDGFAGRGRCDFHEELATPLPSRIFLPLMGLPREDLPMFLRWRDMNVRPDVAPGDFGGAERVRQQASREMNEYFRGAIADRRTEPDDGLLSHIVHAEIEGRPLTETELLGMSHLLLVGGLDTVTATLDCMVAFLATHDDHRRQIVEDPSIVPSAVEELLRWLTPVMLVPRAVAQDVELRGVQLYAGDAVNLVLGAANMDEDAFGEPEVDFGRDPNRHLAFGGSHHLCLGAHLARLELRVALEELHARIPDYRIAEGADVRYSTGIRQANHLPLEFDPA